MKKFLFIYSLVITLGLSFFFAFTNPSKSTLIISLLILPIPMYLFISLTNPKEVSAPKWSLRVILVIFLLSLLAVASFKLLNINTVSPEKTIDETQVDGSKVENINQSPTPTAKIEKTEGSQDFTDILLEESKTTND